MGVEREIKFLDLSFGSREAGKGNVNGKLDGDGSAAIECPFLSHKSYGMGEISLRERLLRTSPFIILLELL